MSKEKDFHNYGEITGRDILKAIGIKFTQADKIRSMSDNELAEFLREYNIDKYPWGNELIDWLQSEVEE